MDQGGAQQTPRLDKVLDAQAQRTFVEFFNTLPEDGTIRFFQRMGGKVYYSCHGANAEALRSWYLKYALEVYSIGTGKKLNSTAFSPIDFEEMTVDLLLHKNSRVEVWSMQDRKSWTCIKKGSPGNMQDFEDIVVSDALGDSPVVMALTHAQEGGRIKFGCAYYNNTLRALGVSEFTDGDQFLNLEAFLIQIGAKECLVPASGKVPSPEDQQIDDILTRTSVTKSETKRASYSPQNVVSDLGILLTDTMTAIDEMEMKLAMQAMAALLGYLELTADDTNHEQLSLKKEDLRQFMKLDTAAVKALNLFPTRSNEDTRSAATLYGLLNRCQTAMGQRTLRQWIAQPLLDPNEIRKRQDLVEIFTDDVLFCSVVRDDILKNIPDLDMIMKRMQRKKAKLEDAVTLSRFLDNVPQLLESLRRYEGAHQDTLRAAIVQPMEEISQYFENLATLIENTLDTTGPEVLIQPSFDDVLEQLADQRRKVDYEINKAHKKMLQDLDISDKYCKMERNAQQGFFWRIHRAKAEQLPKNFEKSGYETLLSNKSGTQFTCSTLKSMNVDYNELLKSYMHRQSDLEKKFLETVASYCPVLEDVKHYITLLDLLVSFATVAMNAPTPYVRPTIRQKKGVENVFHVEGARHPMLEVQEGVTFIPNDIHLDKERNLLLITGPNMGGKSTYIRTAGVIQLLAQLGMFVPATSATISVRDSILARIGATDYQVRGVSTFMAEMLETSSILSNATENSFVIIDELGRGTSTYDGFGLAWAIAESIANEIGAACLFATHFHEMTHMAKEHSNIKNLHVTADTSTKTITMLYQVHKGACEKSFGIHVAELARFPDQVVQTAKRKACELEDFGGDAKKARVPLEAEAKDTINSLLKAFCDIPTDDNSALHGFASKLEESLKQNTHLQSTLLEVM